MKAIKFTADQLLRLLLLLVVLQCLLAPARGQMSSGVPLQALGYCQVSAATLASAGGFSGCVGASFTGTCSGSTLTASAVTGDIGVGWPLTGTGITAGTFVQSLGTGTGGAGTYTTSQPCTSSSNSLTTVGPPNGANIVLIQAETQNIRWRDDGGAPTTTVGMLLLTAQPPFLYTGPLSKPQFIDATAGGILDASFYKSP